MSSWFPTRKDHFLGNFVERYAQLLNTKYQVSVIHTQGDSEIKSIDVQDFRVNGVHEVIVYYPQGKNRVFNWWYRSRALAKAFKRIEDVDLIYAHVFMNKSWQFVRAKFHYHAPLIIQEHASYFNKNGKNKLNQLQKQQMRNTSMYAKKICAVSEVLKQDMKATFPTTKIEVIPNIVLSNLFRIKDDTVKEKTHFVHISTLDPFNKNPKMLFEGFALAVKNCSSNIHLSVVSDQDTSYWKNWVDENQLSEHISFHGPFTWEEIAKFLPKNDVLIQTSDYESFGIVMAEAWMCGIPVIATDVGVAHDLPQHLGISIAKKSPESLAKAIETMVSGETHYFPGDIRNHAMQFSEQVVLSKLTTLFENYFDEYE